MTGTEGITQGRAVRAQTRGNAGSTTQEPTRRWSATQTVASDVQVGADTWIGAFVNLYGCVIGDRSRIGPFVEIQRGATIGRDCKISSHSFLCEGVTLEDEVFVGHGVVFTNDRYPRATTTDGRLQTAVDWTVVPTLVRRGASIGSGTTLLPGITVGRGAVIGAGSVVTRDIPDGVVAMGNPCRVHRRLEPVQTGVVEEPMAVA